tara:strand:- start:55695 stop:55979 length:285 start_codon:yes stop_codon:yes gene_type:complete
MVSNAKPIKPQQPACRVILDFNDETVFRMKRMAAQTNAVDLVELTKQALSMYEVLLSKVNDGMEIMIVDNKGMTQERLEFVSRKEDDHANGHPQ